MNFSNDWGELLGSFLRKEVEFLLVGGHAVGAYGLSR